MVAPATQAAGSVAFAGACKLVDFLDSRLQNLEAAVSPPISGVAGNRLMVASACS